MHYFERQEKFEGKSRVVGGVEIKRERLERGDTEIHGTRRMAGYRSQVHGTYRRFTVDV